MKKVKYDKITMYNVVELFGYHPSCVVARVIDYYDGEKLHTAAFDYRDPNEPADISAISNVRKFRWFGQSVTEDNIDELLGDCPRIYDMLVDEIPDEPQASPCNHDTSFVIELKYAIGYDEQKKMYPQSSLLCKKCGAIFDSCQYNKSEVESIIFKAKSLAHQAIKISGEFMDEDTRNDLDTALNKLDTISVVYNDIMTRFKPHPFRVYSI